MSAAAERRAPRAAIRTLQPLLEDLEDAKGVAAPTEVLMLCKMARAQERTIAAQRDLIGQLGREKAELRKASR